MSGKARSVLVWAVLFFTSVGFYACANKGQEPVDAPEKQERLITSKRIAELDLGIGRSYIYYLDDKEHGVECWIQYGGGISCLPKNR